MKNLNSKSELIRRDIAYLLKFYLLNSVFNHLYFYTQVDCANGVGANSLRTLAPLLSDYIDIFICNDGSSGKLNENCGADFVKVGTV